MNFKKILICAFFIAFNIALNASWASWARSWTPSWWFGWKQDSPSVSLLSEDKVNYLHSAEQTLDIEVSKSDWKSVQDDNKIFRAQAILYIYSILVKNTDLELDLFAIEDVMKVIDNQTVPNIDFKELIQGAINSYINRKERAQEYSATDAANLSDANFALSEVESKIIEYLLNAVDDDLDSLVVSLSILNEK